MGSVNQVHARLTAGKMNGWLLKERFPTRIMLCTDGRHQILKCGLRFSLQGVAPRYTPRLQHQLQVTGRELSSK